MFTVSALVQQPQGQLQIQHGKDVRCDVRHQALRVRCLARLIYAETLQANFRLIHRSVTCN